MCVWGETQRERERERKRERERERESKRERDHTEHTFVACLERCAVSQPSSESLCSSPMDNIPMEVVQELLDASKLKKNAEKKPPVRRRSSSAA